MKRTRKLIALLCAVMIVAVETLIPVAVNASAPTSTWYDAVNQTTANAWLAGAGSGKQEDPYLVKTPSDLASVAWLVASDASKFVNEYIKIDDSVTELDMGGKLWYMIGAWNVFKGNFDGNGKPIKNVLINMDGTNATVGNAWYAAGGLFGQVQDATIKNVVIEDEIIYNFAGNSGERFFGGLVGKATNVSIQDCSVDAKVEVPTTVGSANVTFGGLVGNALGSTAIDGCMVNIDADITTAVKASSAGAFAGAVRGTTTIKNSGVVGAFDICTSVSNSKLGGFAGSVWDTSNIKNSFSTVSVTDSSAVYARVCGFAGHFVGGTIENCASYGEVKATINATKTFSDGVTTTGCYDSATEAATAVASLNTWVTANGADTYSSWETKFSAPVLVGVVIEGGSEPTETPPAATPTVTPTDPDAPPTANWHSEISGKGTFANDWYAREAGTETEPHLVKTADELAAIPYLLSADGSKFENEYIKIDDSVTELDMGGKLWYMIGAWNVFKGNFDGNDKTIKNISINMDGINATVGNKYYAAGGLFGQIQNATIKNVVLKAEKIYDFTGNEAERYFGGLAGKVTSSAIKNCSVELTVAEPTVTGTKNTRFGGLVGSASGTSIIDGCSVDIDADITKPIMLYSAGALSGAIANTTNVTNSSASGTINICTSVSNSKHGGFVGSVWDTSSIKNCFSTVSVTDSSNVYARVCGFVGHFVGGTIENCASYGEVKSTINATKTFSDGVTTTGCYDSATEAATAAAALNAWVRTNGADTYLTWIAGANGAKFDDVVITQDGNKYSVNVEDFTGVVMFAGYNSQGKCVEIQQADSTYSATLTAAGITQVKVFFWDSLATMVPNRNNKEITVTGSLEPVTPAMELYVDLYGNNNNDGTEDAPFATIEAAQAAAAEIDQESDIVINIGEGVYYREQPIEINVENSGKNGYDVIYRGAGAGQTVISGGVNVGNTFSEYKDGIYVMDVPSDIDAIRELYINGEKRYRASSERMFKAIQNPSPENADHPYDYMNEAGNRYYGFFMDKNDVPMLSKPADAECVWLTAFAYASVPITYIFELEGQYCFYMQNGTWDWLRNRREQDNTNRGPDPSEYFIIRNAIEFLDSPGEFYFDTTEDKLYYMPTEDENITTASVVIPRLDRAVSVIGNDIDEKVENVTIENMTFANYTSDYLDGTGAIQGQATQWGWADGHRTPAAVYVERASNINFYNNHFFGFTGSAIDMINSVDNSSACGNTFSEIGNTAVVVGSPAHTVAVSTAPGAENESKLTNLIDGETPLKVSSNSKMPGSGYSPTSDHLVFISKTGGYFVHDKTYIDDYSINVNEVADTSDTWVGSPLFYNGKAYARFDFKKKYSLEKVVVGVDTSQCNAFDVLLSNDREFKTYTTAATAVAPTEDFIEIDVTDTQKYRYMRLQATNANENLAFKCAYAFTDDIAPYTRFERCTNIKIENNYLKDIGVDSFGGGIQMYFGENIAINNNELENLGYSGIMTGWSWSSGDAACSDISVKNNRITNCNLALPDGGAIYTLGYQAGNSEVSGNFVDKSNMAYGAFYADQGSKDITWTNNAAQNARRILHFWTDTATDITATSNYGANSSNILNAKGNVTAPSVYGSGIYTGAVGSIVDNAGLLPEYARIKTWANTSFAPALDETALYEKHVADSVQPYGMSSLDYAIKAEIENMKNYQSSYDETYYSELMSAYDDYCSGNYTSQEESYLSLRDMLFNASQHTK